MGTTRNIRIANGVKKIDLGNENMAMLQIGDVLKEHRQILINSMLSDLPSYIRYQFRMPATKEQLQQIKTKLLDLKNSAINLSRYGDTVSDVMAKESSHVRSEPFYLEINEVIGEEMNPSQLRLVK